MRRFAAPLVLLVGLLTSSCAGSVEGWIANTRVHQGDAALAQGSLHEAETAYRLALRVNPKNERARAGFARASEQVAQSDYRHGDFEDALATLNSAAKYAPGDIRLAAMRSEIEHARIKRDIVISNYPTYQGAATELQAAYVALNVENRRVLHSLNRFGYTFDTQDLTKAIEDSYDMQLDLVRNTNRLIAYRQLVESGVPASQKAAQAVAPTGSLLPLP